MAEQPELLDQLRCAAEAVSQRLGGRSPRIAVILGSGSNPLAR